jgi:Ca2+-binding EF-hand superfamily protein
VLCGGSRDDKVRAAFELFDLDGDGSLDRGELKAYLSSVFTILYETNRGAHAHIEVDASTLAEATTNAAFNEAGITVPHKISLGEFTRW